MATKRTKTPKTTPPKGLVTVGKPVAASSNIITVFGIPFEQGGDNYTFGKARYTPGAANNFGGGIAAPWRGGGGVLGNIDINVWNFIRYDDKLGNPGYVMFRRHTDGMVDLSFQNDVQFQQNYSIMDDADLSSF
jgi:hypothetical protein